MTELVWNPATKKLFGAYVSDPAHALLLSGPVGIGLGSSARELARRISEKEAEIMVIEPEKGLISIERVRKLYEQTRSKRTTRRCIVLDDADAMSPDAQNALLKLLEEPVENVHFILTTHHDNRLLPTVRSRTHHIAMLPVDESSSLSVLGRYGLDETKTRQALFLAAGLPAELTRLGEQPEHFTDQAGRITDARNFLQADAYTRLSIIKRYTDRQTALDFLSMCAKLIAFSVLRQRNIESASAAEAIETAGQRITANGHVRTQLAYLVTKLR